MLGLANVSVKPGTPSAVISRCQERVSGYEARDATHSVPVWEGIEHFDGPLIDALRVVSVRDYQGKVVVVIPAYFPNARVSQ